MKEINIHTAYLTLQLKNQNSLGFPNKLTSRLSITSFTQKHQSQPLNNGWKEC